MITTSNSSFICFLFQTPHLSKTQPTQHPENDRRYRKNNRADIHSGGTMRRGLGKSQIYIEQSHRVVAKEKASQAEYDAEQ
jgi:hypothetical protein